MTILMSITCTTITMTTITILSELITTNQVSFGHQYGNNSVLVVRGLWLYVFAQRINLFSPIFTYLHRSTQKDIDLTTRAGSQSLTAPLAGRVKENCAIPQMARQEFHRSLQKYKNLTVGVSGSDPTTRVSEKCSGISIWRLSSGEQVRYPALKILFLPSPPHSDFDRFQWFCSSWWCWQCSCWQVST